MLLLQYFVLPLQFTQSLEFRDGLIIQLDTLGHDQSLPSLFSPA